MAKLTITYDEKGKTDFNFEDNNEDTDLSLIKHLFTIAEALSIEIISKKPELETNIDEMIVSLCNTYLSISETYKVNKKVLKAPIPAIHPLIAFKGFKR